MSVPMFGKATHTCPKCGGSVKFNVIPIDPRCSQCNELLVPIVSEPTPLVQAQAAYEGLSLNPNDG